MALIRWNPVRDGVTFPSDMFQMQREIDRMFDRFLGGSLAEDGSVFTSNWTPAVDITEHENEYIVKMELPGVSKDDVKITLENSVLTVKGEKKQEKESKSSNFHRVERTYGSFQRTFTVPSGVKADSIDASYKDGILNIALPKAEEAKPKQIDVKVK
ncbi:MAG TPA: Hsp20/alpha crystallin family protein [Bacteroidota bacterium]|nr:Hsp20/alpha crystallin family protein [Bacteroidota bacterium]